MAKAPKIDEQISYNGTFFVCAGLFGLVTFWAVYDEAVTRREWKGYQDEFYKIERKLAHGKADAAKKALDESPEYNKLVADLKDRKSRLNGPERAAYEAAQASLKQAGFDRFDAQQNLTFAKSILDENYYYYTLAKHGDDPAKLAELTKKNDELDARVKARKEDLDKAAHVYADRQSAVEAFTKPIEEAEKRIQILEKDVKEANRLAAKADDRSPEVIQRDLEDVGRVDRCESCHVGATRGGFETVKPGYFASHPYRRTLLGIHPPEKFGCTECHDGQGRATTKFYAHAPDRNEDPHAQHTHFWEQPLLKKLGSFAGFGDDQVKANFVEGSCRKCHVDEFELRSTLACESDTECLLPGTRAEATALKCAVPTAPGFAPAAAVKNPTRYCVDGDGRPELVDLAPQQARGRKIIEEAGCFGCHPIDGYDRPKPAPDLRHVRSKINPAWMVAWISHPQSLRPNTRMPDFFPEDHRKPDEAYPAKAIPQQLGDAEADRLLATGELYKWRRDRQVVAIASYLLDQSTPFDVPTGKTAGGSAARGEKLVRSLGCLGCHVVEGSGVVHKNRGSHLDHGPSFADIGAKTSADWIFAWLKDPKAYNPGSRMPNLRLSDQEAADIAVWLAGQKKTLTPLPERTDVDPGDKALVERGQWLVKYYGCYGCHMINGLETTPGIGVALSAFGAKNVEQLDYGDYIGDHNRQTWESWTYNKLRRPRVYRYDRVDTRMPQFGLTEQEIKDVMVVLKGMRGEERDPITGRPVPLPTHALGEAEKLREKGRAMVRWFNCYGCHTVDGHTGDIRQAYPGDMASLAPPILNNEGARTQPAWLFAFFKNVKSLRPWLSVRMPTFGFTDDQATNLVGMFSAFDKADFPYRYYAGIKLEGPRKEVGHAVFTEFKCQSCHVLGDVKICSSPPEPGCIPIEEASQKAPNLLMARDRLRAEWIVNWLENPEAIMPGTRMPSFFPEGMNQLDAMLNLPETKARFATLPQDAVNEVRGSTLAQRELLRDYLMTLEPAAPALSGGRTNGKTKKSAAGPRSGKRASADRASAL